jgi:hypothetical protein
MQKYFGKNIQAKIVQFWASFVDVFKYWKIALIALVLVGSIGGGLREVTVNTEVKGFQNWKLYIPKGYEELKQLVPGENFEGYDLFYNTGMKKSDERIICVTFPEKPEMLYCGLGDKNSPDFDFHKNCAVKVEKFNNTSIDLTKITCDSQSIGNASGVNLDNGVFPTYAAVEKTASTTATKPVEFNDKVDYCKIGDGRYTNTQGSLASCTSENTVVFSCDRNNKITPTTYLCTNPATKETFACRAVGSDNECNLIKDVKSDTLKSQADLDAIKTKIDSSTPTVQATTSGQVGGAGLGGLFSILYKVVITILLIVLILIEYVQMIILTIMAYIISALLDLSPSAPILTKIGLPLWQIFANLANFLVVGFMVYVGAATMIGLRKTEQAGKDVVTIAVLAMLLNTTYFFLNFVITTVDGFSRLLISVFVGNGGLFGLFSGLFGLFSKVSVLRDGKGAIDVSSPVSAVGNFAGTLGSAVGAITTQFGANDNGAALTFTFLGEALVVISFFIILLIFKDTFVLVFARVTILLLLLITSPVWVVAFFLKDIFKSSPISAAISKLPSQLFGTIFYNFALVLGIIITVLVTGSAQEGFKGYKLDIANSGGTIAGNAADSANFLSPNGASLIIAGVVPVFLGVAILYFINQAFKNLFPLLDQIGTQIGNGATDIAKGIISGDVKGGITKTFKAATTLATGGGQLENIATTAPKLAVKGGIMGLGGLAMIGDGATGGRLGLQQRLANTEDRFVKPFVYKPTEALSNWAGERFGENSDQNLNAKERTKRIRDQKKGIRDDRNRGVVANSMDEYNNSNALTGGRRFLVTGANAKLDADIAEKRMNAGKKNIEQEGRQQFIDGNANRIQEASRLDQLANDNEGRVNARLSQEEERGKEINLNSPEGREALRTRILAEQNLEQLKVIADNLKSGQESRSKAEFYNDATNRATILNATTSTITTGLRKDIDEAQIATSKANIESQIYATPSRSSGEIANLYTDLTNAKYGAGGQSSAETARDAGKKILSSAYKEQQRKEAAFKQRKEDVEKEKEKNILLRSGRDAIPGITLTATQRPISTTSGGDDLNQITQAQIAALDVNDGIAFESYRDALNNWESEDLEFDKAILENVNNASNSPGGVRLPEADALLTSYRQKKSLHALKKPAI